MGHVTDTWRYTPGSLPCTRPHASTDMTSVVKSEDILCQNRVRLRSETLVKYRGLEGHSDAHVVGGIVGGECAGLAGSVSSPPRVRASPR